jgi:hypothetical protein
MPHGDKAMIAILRGAFVVLLLGAALAAAQEPSTWNFVVSGDSRNCGDVVMPAIAAGSKHDGAAFYWHLGDFRAIFAVDEDIAGRAHGSKPHELHDYQKLAWQDAIENQIAPFGDIPFYAGIGNHETIPPKSRAEFVETFTKWLDSPTLQKQRQQDDASDTTVKAYYHWRQQGIDFISLDNASADEFDPGQLTWLRAILTADKQDSSVKAVIVGMHAALPNSLAAGHSMNNWKVGVSSGERVYTDLLDFRNQTRKKVYVVASHSHFYMRNIFATEYWKSNGGVLPGWIVGTAGAHRYALPPDANQADEAKTNVYGYLLATAHDNGSVDFTFKELKESDIPKEVVGRYGSTLVHQCFSGNSDVRH